MLQKDENGEFVALIIAGGGGGKSYDTGHEAIRADGGLSPPGTGTDAYTPSDGPGMAFHYVTHVQQLFS